MIGKNISGRRCARWLALVLWVGVAVSTNADAYLPRLGPAALRYQSPAPLMIAVLPPLLMNDPAPPAPTAPIVEEKKIASTQPPVTPPTVEPPPPPPAPVVPLVLEVSSPVLISLPGTNDVSGSQETGGLTPQMLIKFFDLKGGGTNRPGGLAVPFIFTPPQPGATHSSTATFLKQ